MCIAFSVIKTERNMYGMLLRWEKPITHYVLSPGSTTHTIANQESKIIDHCLALSFLCTAYPTKSLCQKPIFSLMLDSTISFFHTDLDNFHGLLLPYSRSPPYLGHYRRHHCLHHQNLSRSFTTRLLQFNLETSYFCRKLIGFYTPSADTIYHRRRGTQQGLH